MERGGEKLGTEAVGQRRALQAMSGGAEAVRRLVAQGRRRRRTRVGRRRRVNSVRVEGGSDEDSIDMIYCTNLKH